MSSGNACPVTGDGSVSFIDSLHATSALPPPQISPLEEGSSKRIFTLESAFATSPLMRPEPCWNASLSTSPESFPSVPQRSCCFARTQTSFASARGLFALYWMQTLQIDE